MQPPSYALSHDASALFRRLAEGASLRPLDAPEHGPLAEADAMLASLLDLSATVRLADHLAIHARNPLPATDVPASPLRQKLAKKVGEVRSETSAAFEQPFVGRRALPTAATVLRVLHESRALETRERAEARAAGDLLKSQARERFDHQLARSRQRLRWLRTDFAGEIRALGPRAAQLEAFDAVLTRSLENGQLTLHHALERRLDDVFVTRFVAAVAALPTDAVDVDRWYQPGGVLHRHAADLGALLRLLVDHEIDAFHALVDTAFALRNQGPSE